MIDLLTSANEPLNADQWVVNSLLQKSIRRGEIEKPGHFLLGAKNRLENRVSAA